jgi:tryptophanyl-tRNA synthetase
MHLPTSASPFDAPPSSNSREALKLGLFSYPVLQAADILLYGTTHVPVGEDQAQHLEFTRDLANSFNIAHNKTIFQLPETILSPAKRVMSLKEPSKKMSKSDANEMSRILITDSWEMIKKKVNGAITDSIEGITYDRQARPGVSNLVDLMFYMDESSYASPKILARDLEHVSLKALKEKVAEKIERSIKPVREKYEWLIQEDQTSPFLWDLNIEAAGRAEKLAEERLRRVKEALGLVGF